MASILLTPVDGRAGTVRRIGALSISILLALLLAALAIAPARAQSTNLPPWVTLGPDDEPRIQLYFFWSSTCPHCREAHPFIMDLPEQLDWLDLHSYELAANPDHPMLYMQMAEALGEEAQYVPAFFFCGTMVTGYDHADTTGAAIVEGLSACYEDVQAQTASQAAGSIEQATDQATDTKAGGATNTETNTQIDAAPALAPMPAAAAAALTVPILGTVDAQAMSLPLFTVVIAGLDAFNPCAFFVLLFLLSLLVHARSRSRMLIVGGVFVLFSGLVYFIFMSAWLNVFMWFGELRLITVIAGMVAVAIALINIKDYFWFKQGVSLSIPERAKPGLYRRMRGLVQAGKLPAMLASTAVLALAANSYELLCTSGFPMVYTRVLTLHDLAPDVYYLYLAAYNLVYILPLLLIVVVFTLRFGARKLAEEEGRNLKLISGVMMLLLGIVLVAAPALLNQVWSAALLLLAAVAISLFVILIDRRLRPGSSRFTGSLRPH